jgi:hypothetical protein
MTYACHTWKFTADTHLLKLQCPENKVIHIVGNFLRCTPVHNFHMAFNLTYVYHITKLCRQEAEVIQSHENDIVCSIRQSEARPRKYKRLKLGSGQAYNHSSD